MRHASRIWFPTLLIAVLATAGAGSSSSAWSGPLHQAKAVTAGVNHTCALTRSGAVQCWGYNGHDELGTGFGDGLPYIAVPVDVAGLTGGVLAISAGLRHSCAVTSAQGVECWGVNYGGALGDGTLDRHFAPVNVVGLGGPVTAVSAGDDRSCALLSGGVKCWGTDYGLAPVDIDGLTSGVVGLSAGVLISCAVTSVGGVKCWGYHYGHSAVDVPGLSGATAVTASGPLCALTSIGGVKCWGPDSSWSPVDVPGLSAGVRAVGSASGHACALTGGGGVKCWGSNDHGQLGDGTTTDSTTPVDVAGLSSGVVAIATGAFHSCAVLGTGGVKCWGWNSAGMLGDTTEVERHRPVSVFGFGPPAKCLVPNVVGKRIAKARLAVARAHCAVGRVARVASNRARNIVVRQSPKAGKRLKAGSKVNLAVSS